MIRRVPVLLILAIICSSSVVYAVPKAVKDHRKHLARGDYHMALSTLSRRWAQGPGTVERGEILVERARFYENHVGDIDAALGYYEKVMTLSLPASNEQVLYASNQVVRLTAMLERHSDTRAFIAQIAKPTKYKEDLPARVEAIDKYIEQNPNSPYLTSLFFHKGSTFLALEKYYSAYHAFEMAVNERPAIMFDRDLPATRMRITARRMWAQDSARRVGRGLLAVVLTFGCVMFLVARPWRWFGVRHVVLLVLLVGAWWVTWYVSVRWIGSTHEFRPSVDGKMAISAAQSNVMAGVLNTVLRYGVFGVLILFFVCSGTTVIRLRVTRVVVNILMALLLFFGLCVHLVVNHCDVTFERNKERHLSRLSGEFRFVTDQPLPFVLMDPRAYPEMDIDGLDEKVCSDYVKRHYARIEQEKKEQEAGQ